MHKEARNLYEIGKELPQLTRCSWRKCGRCLGR